MRRWLEIGFVIALLAVNICLRTYRLDAPLADWHSWRQADTAAVARNFVKDKFDLLYPQSDSLLALNEHNLTNPNRYFINEFPLYNAIVATIYRYTGVNHVYGRIVSIVVSAIGALALYGIVRHLLGKPSALLTLGYYSVLPYNVYYNRVFMPDPLFAALSILSVFWCIHWVSSEKNRYGLALMITFALAMLVKPYSIFMSIPLFYWIVINWKTKMLKNPLCYLVAIGSFIPVFLWRQHLAMHPEGSFASTWLLNGGNIRFTGAFFRWIIFDRFNRLIFATGGFVLFIAGFFSAHLKKNTSLFFVWALAILFYITVFAKGNVNHDYYQLPIVAPGSVLIAIGATALIKLGKNWFQKAVNTCLVVALLAISLAFGWYEVRGFFNINNPAIVAAGAKIDEITPKDAIVIAPYQGDPAFLYQTNRHGWPIGGDIETKIRLGSTYYVTTSRDDEYNLLKQTYAIVFENDAFSIIKLTK